MKTMLECAQAGVRSDDLEQVGEPGDRGALVGRHPALTQASASERPSRPVTRSAIGWSVV